MIAFFKNQGKSELGVILKDILNDGVLKLIKVSNSKYAVSYTSIFQGCSWVSEDMDFIEARLTYNDVIVEEYI